MTPKLSHSKAGGVGGQEFSPEDVARWSESSGRHLLAETSRQPGVGGGGGQHFTSDRDKPGLASLTVKAIHCLTDTRQKKGEKRRMRAWARVC